MGQAHAAAHRPRSPSFEAAVPAGEDPVRYAQLLRRVREAILSGERPPATPRLLIADSWRRAIRLGVDPDRDKDPVPAQLEEVEQRRRDTKLGRIVPVLGGVLLPAAEDAGHVMVVVDRDGVVLWRKGPRAVHRRADELGFSPGANWGEASVGTNAIGTALAVGYAVQVYSAEHFVKSHHAWTCAAAPIYGPADGALLGVIDVSGAAATVHANTLALVDAAARMAEHYLLEEHHEHLDALRSTAAPLLARIGGAAFVTDPDGWVAGATGVAPIARLALPEQRDSDFAWLPVFGVCRLEPLPGGWLVRLGGGKDTALRTPATSVELDLRDPRVTKLGIISPSGQWSYRLSPRHAELLLILATRRDGRSAAELSIDLFGTPEHTVTVRAQLSRLRRNIGGVLLQRPYRFAEWVDVRMHYPDTPEDLLPASSTSAIRALRGELALCVTRASQVSDVAAGAITKEGSAPSGSSRTG